MYRFTLKRGQEVGTQQKTEKMEKGGRRKRQNLPFLKADGMT